MAKEDKPLEYQRRLRDTKGVAQRLDLSYLRRPGRLLWVRRRATWMLLALAVLGGLPLVLGIGGTRKLVENGPLSQSHAIFENRCEVCHAAAFGGVPDKACNQCHDGASHPAKAVDTGHANMSLACAQCHREHRGKTRLAAVSNANCSRCHADLRAHATGVKIKGTHITAFEPGRHPEFSSLSVADTRPIKLNHAIHMPAQAREIRGIKLPMQCGDCHAADGKGSFLPVTFDANCKSCHARELEFDVYHVGVPAAPHAKDVRAIREYIEAAYRTVLAAEPGLARRPLRGNDLAPQPGSAVWLARVVKDSETYLFDRKCIYCHTGPGSEIPRVNRIAGRYVETRVEGAPWMERGEFGHRAHRAIACDSCHTQARKSTMTADVLLPAMKSCTGCHGASGTSLDDCTTCHQYHNRGLEKDRGRPMDELMGDLR